MKILINDYRACVERREPFKGSNCYAEWKGDLYVVYSYGEHWPLYVYDDNMLQWYDNVEKYGNTTSNHHSKARPKGVSFVEVNCDELKEIIEKGGLRDE